MAVAEGNQASAAGFCRRLVRCVAVVAVLVAAFAAMPVAAATSLPTCAEPLVMTVTSPEVTALVGVQNAIVSECEASNVRAEVSQSVAHDDAWLILGVVASTIIASAFFRVVLR